MDYSKLKRKDLLKRCLEKGVKGCSNKKMDYMILKLKAIDDQQEQSKDQEEQQEQPKDQVQTETNQLIKPAPTYTIINSSCIEGLQTLKEASTKVHLTVTSPPYFNVQDYVNYDSYTSYLHNL